LAVVLLLSSPQVLKWHVMAWSEPAFLALLLAAVALLAHSLHRGRRAALVAAGACFGPALLTRYAGLALVPPAVGRVCAQRMRSWRQRGADAALLALLALGPLALWTAHNARLAGSATDRVLAFHAVGVGHAGQLATTLWELWGVLPLPVLWGALPLG